MADPRIAELAKVMVEYSTNVKKGDFVVLKGIGAGTLPLLRELHKQCLKRGAIYVEYQIVDPDMERDFLNLANEDQVKFFPKLQLDLMKKADVFIGVRAQDNTMSMANANQKNYVTNSRTMHKILDQRVNTTRWVVTHLPTHGVAQDAKMSLEEFEDFYYNATIFDYVGLKKRQEKLVRLMEKTDRVKIKASDTDLEFSIKGIPAISCFGDRNVPDGEVFTAPVKTSVNGFLKFNTPTVYQGKEFTDIRLEFEKGKIVKATSPGMDKALNDILDTDAGARYIGEFAIGTNANIRRPMRNILFDEKIFGSFHFTPGRCYDEAPNGNPSAIHWDMVKILTGDGDIFFDDKLIHHKGIFVAKSLLDLNPPKERKVAEKFLLQQAAKKKK
jgi:aminopeptidase